jgi:hypothetical protein
MRKYILTTCNGTVKEFNRIEDLIEILASDPITELTNNEICLLDGWLDIQRENKRGEFLYKVEVKTI